MTQLQIDTFLKIGKTHKMCEDYIISGNDPVPYIILADGCSSSKNTEMGARILCYLAKQFLSLKNRSLFSYSDMGTWIINNAEMTARQLGLNSTSLDTTLIISWFEQDIIHIMVYGDGIIVLRDLNGFLTITKIDYSKNAPYYLSYQLDSKRNLDYKVEGIKRQTTTVWEENNEIDFYEREYDEKIIFGARPNSYDLCMICSDGLSSFYDKKNPDSTLELLTTSKEFTNFKSTAGEFLKRRFSKAIQKYEKQGIFHADDISAGCYLFKEEQDE